MLMRRTDFIEKSIIKLSLMSCILLVSTIYADANEPKKITSPAGLSKIADSYRSKAQRLKDFVVQGDGTVVDKRTGLQWMRCGLGQTWTGKTCEGEAKKYMWEEAKKQTLNFAQYNDWRLATLPELETLVYCSSGKDMGREYILDPCDGEYQVPTIADEIFPNTKDEIYWSSSIDTDDDDAALRIGFYDGSTHNDYKSEKHYIRLVCLSDKW